MKTSPTIWKQYVRRVAWPTVALAVAVWLAYGGLVGLALTGELAWPVAAVGLTLVAYAAFTPMHEAAHGNVSGGVAGWRWLDPAVGWAMSLLFGSPFWAFRAVHLRHHGRTNQDDDPDLWVASPHPLGVVARCLTILPHYHWVYLRRLMWATPASAREGRVAAAVLLATAAAAVGVAIAGGGAALLALWLGPVWLASGMLAFAFDWLPHVPHQRIGRYVDTRAIDVRALDAVLLGQNLHNVHHLYPRVPFFRYRAVFDAMADEFEAAGTEIWRPRPPSPATTTGAKSSKNPVLLSAFHGKPSTIEAKESIAHQVNTPNAAARAGDRPRAEPARVTPQPAIRAP